MKRLLILMLLLFLCATCRANAWYVTAGGNDANGGTGWDDAFATITQAITSASANDTIYMGSGTWDETADLDTANKGLIIDGVDKTAAISRTGANQKGVIVENGTILRNLTISSTSNTASSAGVYCGSKSNILIEDCNITGGADGMYISGCGAMDIRRSVVRGNYDAMLAGSTDLQISNTAFRADGSYGTGVPSRCIFVPLNAVVTLTNCTLKNPRSNATTKATTLVRCVGQIKIINCPMDIILSDAGATGDVFGVRTVTNSGARAIVLNSQINISNTGSGNEYDLHNSAGDIYVQNTFYRKGYISGIIKTPSGGRTRYGEEYFEGGLRLRYE